MNLSEDEKYGLLGGSLSIGTLISTYGLYKYFGAEEDPINATVLSVEEYSEDEVEGAESEDEFEEVEFVEFEAEVPFAEDIVSSMTFSDAFSTARSSVGPGGFFEWKGRTFNTYYKEEWDKMNPDNQKDFIDDLDSVIDKNSIVITTPELGNLMPSPNNILDSDGDGVIDLGAFPLNGENITINFEETEPIINEITNNTDSGPANLSIQLKDDGSIISIMESLDANDDGIIDIGAQVYGTPVGRAMSVLDRDDDGIIDFGSQKIHIQNLTSKVAVETDETIASIMDDLDADVDGIIELGADKKATIMTVIDENDDGIIDFQSVIRPENDTVTKSDTITNWEDIEEINGDDFADISG